VLRAHFETFVAGGLDEAAKLWDRDIEWHAVAGALDDVGVIRRHAAMRRYYSEWIDTMDDLRGDVDDIVYEDDELVVARIHNSGRGRASGVPATGEYYVACVVRDGRIIAGREYSTRAAAVAAAEALGAQRGT
jgi:ketosteroid isomerase-like protein